MEKIEEIENVGKLEEKESSFSLKAFSSSYEIARRFREEQKLFRKSNQNYSIEEIGTTQKYKESTIICS